jgi:predicted MFS family arabinose efflux permease
MDFLDPDQRKDQPAVYGNMWGWKFSFISLGIIVVLLLLAFYRYTSLEKPPLFPQDQVVSQKDSLDRPLPDTLR